MDKKQIVEDFITYQKSDKLTPEENALFDRSVYILQDLVYEDPETAWELILEIVAATDDEKVLSLLGCGELENLLSYHFDLFIERVEKQSREDKKFAFAMSCVWQLFMTDEQYERLNNLVKELGIKRI